MMWMIEKERKKAEGMGYLYISKADSEGFFGRASEGQCCQSDR